MVRRSLRAVVLAVLLAACGGDAIPPVPDDLRGLTEQEASCIACHSRGLAPSLQPGASETPVAHPSFDPVAIRTMFGGG